MSYPLHRDMMQILAIARRKIHVALGEKALSEPTKSPLESKRAQNLMNRVNRTCSAEAWKAAFPSSPPTTMIVAFRSEWDCCRLC